MNNFIPHPESISTEWLETLASDEINMDQSGVVRFNEHLDSKSFLEESSVKLMDTLRDLFEIYIHKFNECRNNNSINPDNRNCIKVFKISNTVNDFLIYRNSLKLVLARKYVDKITLQFLSNTNGSFGARLPNSQLGSKELDEIDASLGPFNDVTWKFKNTPINVEALVKHYLTEFIKYSAQ